MASLASYARINYLGFIETPFFRLKNGIICTELPRTDLVYLIYANCGTFFSDGSKFRKNFQFAGELTCGEEAPPILLFSSEFKHTLFNKSANKLGALAKVKAILEKASKDLPNGDIFPMSRY